MWLFLHRHDESNERGGDKRPLLPLLLDTSTGITIQLRVLSGQVLGCQLRRPGDDGKGGMYLAESFAEVCDKLGEQLTLSTDEKAEIAEWVR